MLVNFGPQETHFYPNKEIYQKSKQTVRKYDFRLIDATYVFSAVFRIFMEV
jgi:hypothetical protein